MKKENSVQSLSLKKCLATLYIRRKVLMKMALSTRNLEICKKIFFNALNIF